MNKKIFATYDSKAEAYLQPFFMRARGEAVRAWETVCNDPKSEFYNHPEDFTLFELGEYDELTGTLFPHQAKIALGCAIEFKKVQNLPIAENPKLVNNK